jgi:hypothetical protein
MAEDNIFGEVENPIEGYGDYAEAGEGMGLVGFISNVIRFLTIAAGLFAFLNLLLAGFQFITAGGDPENIAKAWDKIWYSLIGLVIIVASFTIAALLGWLIFRDAGAILQPTIYGPGI